MTTSKRNLRWRGLAVMLAGVFLPCLDFNIVNVSIPEIEKGLHASFADMQLVITAYGLAYAVMLITGGRLGDIYGRKRIFALGMLGFGAASVSCAAAPSAPFLIASRVVQGLAGALIFPQALSYIQATFRGEERTFAFGIFGMALGLGSIFGNALGGILTGWNLGGMGWRPIFWINVPLVAAVLAFIPFWVVETRVPRPPKLDLSGALLATIGLGLLTYPLVVGREVGWPPWTAASIALSLAVLALFVRQQSAKTRRRESPLIEMTLFDSPAFSRGLAVAFVFWWGLSSMVLMLSVFLQRGLGLGPFASGMLFLPFSGSFMIASLLASKLVARLGRRIVQLGTGMMLAGLAWLFLVVRYREPGFSPWWLVPGIAIYGSGQGCTQSPLMGLILSGVAASEAGSASGVLTSVQQTSYAFGVASIGSFFFLVAGANAGGAAYVHAFSVTVLVNAGLLVLTFALVQKLPPKPLPDAMVLAE